MVHSLLHSFRRQSAVLALTLGVLSQACSPTATDLNPSQPQRQHSAGDRVDNGGGAHVRRLDDRRGVLLGIHVAGQPQTGDTPILTPTPISAGTTRHVQASLRLQGR